MKDDSQKPVPPRLPTREPFRAGRDFPLRQFGRRNLLPVTASLIYLVIIILVLVQIDRVYYSYQKRELINQLLKRNDPRILGGEPGLDALSAYSQQYLQQLSRRQRPDAPPAAARALEDLRASLLDAMEKYLQNNPMVWRVNVLGPSNEVLVKVEDESRLATQNNWSNCLIFRDWTGLMSRLTREGDQWLGALEVHHTTPLDVEEIEQLTRRWRGIAAAAVGGMLLLYLLILWTLLLPLRRVIKALDKGAAIGAPLIAHPRTLLERYYNNLARDATLALLSTELREFVRAEAMRGHRPLMEFAACRLGELFPLPGAAIWAMRRAAADGRWYAESVFGPHGPFEPHPSAHRDAAAVAASLAAGTDSSTAVDGAASEPWFSRRIWKEEGRIDLFILPEPPTGIASPSWMGDLCARLAKELAFGMEMVAEQNRLIMTEKRKANISLTRNLGHDLTNIIATSKLELMTVRAFLEMSPEEIRSAPIKQQLFRESLEALLNNTRFLQEIVNLYRSFTYLSHPKFERVRLRDLVDVVSELFQLSISRNVRIVTDFDESLEEHAVEPRLLRLALFNLLSNAADSIKLASTAERPNGEIRLVTRPGRQPGYQEIVVEDTGNGIRGSDGELLAPEKIEDIFRLGYTTKEKGSGEGLGLNWVQQIVRDFHGGEIEAWNLPGGGAAFCLRLPPRTLDDEPESQPGEDARPSNAEPAPSTAR